MTGRAFLLDSHCVSIAKDSELTFVLNSWESGSSSTISLPRVVDENAEAIQTEITEWISELKSSLYQEIRGNLSGQTPEFSEFNPCFEGNYATTPEYYTLAQLMALSSALTVNGVSELTYVGRDQQVSDCLSGWCDRKGIVYSQRITILQSTHRFHDDFSSWRRLLRVVLIGLWNLGRVPALPTNTSVVLWDYLVANPLRAYWGSLLSVIPSPTRTLCIHMFTAHDAVPSIRTAFRHMRRMRTEEPSVAHVLPEELIKLRDLKRICRHYKTLGDIHRQFVSVVEPQLPNIRDLQPSLLLGLRIKSGWRGSAALETATQLVLFERLSHVLAPHSRVFYLQENHTWEKIALYNFSNKVHRMTGVTHTVVRPLDLRYRIIASDFSDENRINRLNPHAIATNGESSWAPLAKIMDNSFLYKVEALRYEYLAMLNQNEVSDPPLVLVFGDLQPRHTAFLLRTIAQPLRSANVQVIFKPHPADHGSAALAQKYGLRTSNEPLGASLKKASLVVAGSITAASTEAAQLHLPVITVVDPEYFNLSPLRATNSSLFVFTSQEVSLALGVALNGFVSNKPNYLCLDPSLPRWKALLVE